MENKEYIRNAFTDEELKNGVWDNWDGRGNILTKKFINLISSKINFDDVKVILDIGSRDGLQSLEFNRWFPNAKVYAFEPIKSSYDFVKNITKDIDNIEAFPYAANSHNGTTKFYEVFNGNVGASSLLKTTNHHRARMWQQKEVEVQCVVMSDFLKTKDIDKVDLIWMDVQGAEEIVINSLGEYMNTTLAIATEVGVADLYENSTNKEKLDNILTNFICVDEESVGRGTELNVIYLNKNL
jgi:FkbM family methyltransferase